MVMEKVGTLLQWRSRLKKHCRVLDMLPGHCLLYIYIGSRPFPGVDNNCIAKTH